MFELPPPYSQFTTMLARPLPKFCLAPGDTGSVPTYRSKKACTNFLEGTTPTCTKGGPAQIMGISPKEGCTGTRLPGMCFHNDSHNSESAYLH